MSASPAPSPGTARGLESPLQFVKGVGPKRAALFARLGVRTAGDALLFFPRRYEDRRAIKPIARAIPGAVETVTGEVAALRVRPTHRRRGRLCEVELSDGTGMLTGLWFHFREPWMRRRFVPGARMIFHGEIRQDGSRTVIIHPEVEELGAGPDESLHFGRIVPVYRLTEQLGQRQVRKVIHETLRAHLSEARESLPERLLAKYHLPGLTESLSCLHFPPPEADLATLNEGRSPWHKRLIFEEFLLLELWLLASRAERQRERRRPLEEKGTLIAQFLRSLPFDLTGAQRKAFAEIRGDMTSEHPMYRLLEGDVGSGKTVVAAMAALLAAENGQQTAVMAPTEILARQHERTFSRLFEGLPVRCGFLASGLVAQERRKVLEGLAGGGIQVAVGTHALLQEDVRFRSLGLVVVDEQHRFGVGHRLTLREKGANPHALVISATPIPRTLAMTLYGDMDLSVIEEMPPGREPVETRVLGEGERELLYELIGRELERGRQTFVVYPLVEESESLELRAAERMAARLARDVFPGHRVGMVHGRLRAADKEKVMEDFRTGVVRLLVSTTVVEVGVDVPAATCMVVEHAERFGLAQLHQLRGRVGRGSQRGLCLLVVSEGAGDQACSRLEVMTRTSDGFRLAEEDLALRGPGEIAGLRQSGAPDLLLANIVRHHRALAFARQEALDLLEGRSGGKFELTKLQELARIKWESRARYLSSG